MDWRWYLLILFTHNENYKKKKAHSHYPQEAKAQREGKMVDMVRHTQKSELDETDKDEEEPRIVGWKIG